MKTIKEIENDIISELAVYDDWTNKYGYLIEISAAMPPMEEEFKTEENRISGCQSSVWLHASYRDGRLYFQADSDAVITKGIIALLLRVFSGQPPADILAADMEFLAATGLQQHLSPNRSEGVLAMIKQIKYYAIAFNQ
ncbi:MAG: SufE family protein [Odoribacteraceae bacterium]|nr:SufE family protein [Odoribacteraceae bacterium]